MRTSPLMPWAAPIVPRRMRLDLSAISRLCLWWSGCLSGSRSADQFDHVMCRFAQGQRHLEDIAILASDLGDAAHLVELFIHAVAIDRVVVIVQRALIEDAVICRRQRAGKAL